jgi:hypothetical protein
MGAHDKPPGERPTMLDLRLEVRQSAAVFSNRNGSWALLKEHISGLPAYGILDSRWNFPCTAQGMSAFGGKADIAFDWCNVCF